MNLSALYMRCSFSMTASAVPSLLMYAVRSSMNSAVGICSRTDGTFASAAISSCRGVGGRMGGGRSV